ncbi:hypothetical protein PTTG_05097 [Puccinia triticina 1-1 BBBD Race 1]|uniref:Uncharacterized protein n=1 Tax=Puccinia triticina (isolate 1-1 / race 1 (BBBD)) TaxID=630390 RepID=A0A0C4EWA7_PUCT1|nr:hypothetical protein PTTG_05097 [Puccinia triticina 1-1 BBBD Race 1]WAR63753.1 hypothetical protein PtB15_17B354 [Puccinia triticina]
MTNMSRYVLLSLLLVAMVAISSAVSGTSRSAVSETCTGCNKMIKGAEFKFIDKQPCGQPILCPWMSTTTHGNCGVQRHPYVFYCLTCGRDLHAKPVFYPCGSDHRAKCGCGVSGSAPPPFPPTDSGGAPPPFPPTASASGPPRRPPPSPLPPPRTSGNK